MGCLEYLTIFATLLLCFAINVFLTRWIFKINVIVDQMDELIELAKLNIQKHTNTPEKRKSENG